MDTERTRPRGYYEHPEWARWDCVMCQAELGRIAPETDELHVKSAGCVMVNCANTLTVTCICGCQQSWRDAKPVVHRAGR